MAERNIAAEVLKGLQEVREHRTGRRTLRTTRKVKPLPGLTPEMIKKIREDLDVSRAVFAHLLRVPVRTVEGWEQGRSNPPDTATALILMARKYPDTLDRLASLWEASQSTMIKGRGFNEAEAIKPRNLPFPISFHQMENFDGLRVLCDSRSNVPESSPASRPTCLLTRDHKMRTRYARAARLLHGTRAVEMASARMSFYTRLCFGNS